MSRDKQKNISARSKPDTVLLFLRLRSLELPLFYAIHMAHLLRYDLHL